MAGGCSRTRLGFPVLHLHTSSTRQVSVLSTTDGLVDVIATLK